MTTLSKNKKALHDYEILDNFEAGIVLLGEEVKSIRGGTVNLRGSYIDIWNLEAFLNECHIPRYKQSSNANYNPTRKRKLILHGKEIEKIAIMLDQKGITAVPLELYTKGGLIKLKIGLCRGKKLYDKRETLRKRDQEIEIKRQLKKYA